MIKARWMILTVALVGLAVAILQGVGPSPGHQTAGGFAVLAAPPPQAEAKKPCTDELEHHIASLEACIERYVDRLADLHIRFDGERLERLLAEQAGFAERVRHMAQESGALARERAQLAQEAAQRTVERLRIEGRPGAQAWVFDSSDGGGWLGVSIGEVTAEKMKELKLPAERGVLIVEVEADSPAAKAGLKANDVITEWNGARIEGAVQFTRLVLETPAGRTAQLTVWRDGRAQTLSAQLGSRRERAESRLRMLAPLERDLRIEIPDIELFSAARTPTLGVVIEDVSGQLGAYFGAPDGKGVLVKEVLSGTPAEKAGLKAGDVIVKIDGKRVQDGSDLRAQLREKREAKSVALAVIRKGAEVSVNVEIEPPKQPERERRRVIRSTTT